MSHTHHGWAAAKSFPADDRVWPLTDPATSVK